MKNIAGGVVLGIDRGDMFRDSEERSAPNSSEAAPRPAETGASGAVHVGRLVCLDEAGRAMVDLPPHMWDRPVSARSIVKLAKEDEGREVVLQFEEGDFRKPIVMGILQPPERQIPDAPGPVTTENTPDQTVITAEKEIVMRCGSASIVLTRSGKILLRGAYIVSRSSGMNRVNGASVQIN